MANYIRNRWVLAWRLALIEAYIALWDTAHPPIEGASQRVHEDTQRFAAGVQGCVATVLDALLTLVVFCPLLWRLDPPLMGVAVGTAVAGVGVSAVVGRQLVDLEVGNEGGGRAAPRLVVLEVEPARSSPTPRRGAGGAGARPRRRLRTASTRLRAADQRALRQLPPPLRELCGVSQLSTYDQFATLLLHLMVAPPFAADEADVLTLGTPRSRPTRLARSSTR